MFNQLENTSTQTLVFDDILFSDDENENVISSEKTPLLN